MQRGKNVWQILVTYSAGPVCTARLARLIVMPLIGKASPPYNILHYRADCD